MSIAVLYEHPEWFQPLFTEFERRRLPVTRIHAGELICRPPSIRRSRCSSTG